MEQVGSEPIDTERIGYDQHGHWHYRDAPERRPGTGIVRACAIALPFWIAALYLVLHFAPWIDGVAQMIDLTSLELGIAVGSLGTMILCLATILHHQRRVLRETREDRRLKP